MKCLPVLILIVAVLVSASCDGPNTAANTSANRPSRTPTDSNATNVTANVPVNAISANANKPISTNTGANRPIFANSSTNNTPQPTSIPRPPPPAPTAEKRDEGLFSFPPPKVTSYALLKSEDLRNPTGPTTFDFVSRKLASGLETAGYTPEKYAFFWSDRDEFAIVTAMERIESDGTPIPEPERWNATTHLPRGSGVDEYFRYLFGGKIVYYRVLAFVVTSKRYGRSFHRNSPPDFVMALNWMNKGEAELGSGAGTSPIESVVFDEGYRCYALLYLFINHTSLDGPKSVDALAGSDVRLEEGLDRQTESHLTKTHIDVGGTRNEP